ncbi:MAG: RNA-binding protein [Crenarchaeota archaeon]|nr:RNA-binding protein [Thermoproteota archaeon]
MTCAIIAKTELGMEKYVANSLDVPCEVVAAPGGFKGLVLLKNCRDFEEAYRKLLEMPEVIRAMKAEKCVRADLEELRKVAKELAERIKGRRFAVRTVRRGSHPFTSVQLNAELGSAVLEAAEAKVDLTEPEVVLAVEIVGPEAYVALVEPDYAGRKKLKGKKQVSALFSKIRVVQEPYTGPPKAARELGRRVGRVVQSYGVGEYVVGLVEPTDARSLASFIEGLEEGARSRHLQRVKAEGEGKIVEIKVFDMYHVVASKGKKEVVVVFEPEGQSFERVSKELGEALAKAKRVTLVLGSRKGVPMGLYRFADFVVDVAPGLVLSTETALAAALEAVALAYLEGARVGPSLPLPGAGEGGEGLGASGEEEG